MGGTGGKAAQVCICHHINNGTTPCEHNAASAHGICAVHQQLRKRDIIQHHITLGLQAITCKRNPALRPVNRDKRTGINSRQRRLELNDTTSQ